MTLNTAGDKPSKNVVDTVVTHLDAQLELSSSDLQRLQEARLAALNATLSKGGVVRGARWFPSLAMACTVLAGVLWVFNGELGESSMPLSGSEKLALEDFDLLLQNKNANIFDDALLENDLHFYAWVDSLENPS